MPEEEFLEEMGGDFGLHLVPVLAARFGSSYEATVYRLATTYKGLAVAGLLRHRYRKAEEKRLSGPPQLSLFTDEPIVKQPEPKYRRQSLHPSLACTPEDIIPWNKSFDETSCVYLAQEPDIHIQRGHESLPTKSARVGSIEAVLAPYQRPDGIGTLSDVLFIWWQ